MRHVLGRMWGKLLNKRYNSINAWLRENLGERVYKVSLESGLSCPNRDGAAGSEGCIFCHPESYYPATSPTTGSRGKSIREQLEEGIAYVRRRHGAEKFIAYFQSGSNTHAPAEKLAPLFREAIAHPGVAGLAVSTRPDCVGSEHVALLGEFAQQALVWVELGLQSAHETTLAAINRGHGVACFRQACDALQSAGVRVCAHIVLGLPGETPAQMIETARFLNDAKVWGVKIHNLHVLRGTELERRYRAGEAAIPSLETYAAWVADVLEELDPAIVVHRVNGHSPRHLTVAPAWSVNKLAIMNAVEAELKRRNSWQGKGILRPRSD